MTIEQAALLQQVEQTRKEMERITHRILLLDRALIYSSARRGLDRVFVPGGLESPEDIDRGNIGDIHTLHGKERAWRRALRMATELSPLVQRKTDAQARAKDFYPREEVLAAIGRDSRRLDTLEGAMDWLDHELQMTNPLPSGRAA